MYNTNAEVERIDDYFEFGLDNSGIYSIFENLRRLSESKIKILK